MITDSRPTRIILSLLTAVFLVPSVAFSQETTVPRLLKFLQEGNANEQATAIRNLAALPVGDQRIAAINGLTALLDSEDPNVRVRSAYTLGYLASGNVDVAKELIELATDNDPQVRKTAIKSLIKIKAPSELTMPIWTKTLQGSDPDAIMQVIHSMAELGDEAIPALRNALKHSEAAYWALLVVSELGPNASSLMPEVLALIDHAQPEIQLQAIIALGKIKGDGAKVVPALVAALNRTDTTLASKYAICFALSEYPDQPAGAEALRATFQGATDVELKLLSGWSLLKVEPNTPLRSEAIQAVIAGLSAPQQRIRQLAVAALGDIKPGADGPSPLVLKAMTDAMRDSDPAVIRQVVDVVAQKGIDAMPVIKAGLANDVLRPVAIELTRRLGADAAPLVPQLIDILKQSEQPEQTREVAFALASVGPAASDAVEPLLARLQSEPAAVKYSVCYALGNIGAEKELVTPRLVAYLESDDEFLKLAAVWSLLKLHPEKDQFVAQSVPLLSAALKNDNEIVRIESAKTLGNLGAAASASLDDLKALSIDESSFVRQAAADAIRKIQAN
ncbi:MAG: HEAT repeat domain-containing protein [Pirellulaceae bacterium]